MKRDAHTLAHRMSQQINKEKVKQLLTNAEKHLHRMFLAGCIFGALACFGRADFNLPLYAFLYIMWDQDDVSFFLLGMVVAVLDSANDHLSVCQ